MRKAVLSLGVVLVAAGLSAEDLTLPAAASIVGGAPFFSDVRAFNTSYAGSLSVTARYHCFIPQPCAAGVPEVSFTLAPRESRAFDDMVASTFQAPNTAGGVEFEFSGGSDQLVVTSRLYSTAPEPTVGMFIPGLKNSEAHPTTVLTSIRNGGAGAGFRTNPGAYNREDSAVNVTFTIFDAGAQVGSPVTRAVAGHSGVQVSGIFTVAGAPDYATENAVIVVSATGEVFSYAAVIDNNTTDPIFVRGAEDQPQQPITPVATVTPGAPTATRTPTQSPPTPTQTPGAATRTVDVGPGGSISFRDSVSQTSTSTIQVGDTVRWVWVSGEHSSTSGPCPPCNGDGLWNSGIKSSGSFQRTFTQAGTFPYFCIPHTVSMTGTVIVNP